MQFQISQEALSSSTKAVVTVRMTLCYAAFKLLIHRAYKYTMQLQDPGSPPRNKLPTACNTQHRKQRKLSRRMHGAYVNLPRLLLCRLYFHYTENCKCDYRLGLGYNDYCATWIFGVIRGETNKCEVSDLAIPERKRCASLFQELKEARFFLR